MYCTYIHIPTAHNEFGVEKRLETIQACIRLTMCLIVKLCKGGGACRKLYSRLSNVGLTCLLAVLLLLKNLQSETSSKVQCNKAAPLSVAECARWFNCAAVAVVSYALFQLFSIWYIAFYTS